jgi:hypothetical protein
MIWRNVLLSALATTLVIAVVGYAIAWHSLDSCESETFREIQRKNIVHTDMLGKEAPVLRSDVYARVTAPFQVEVSYLVRYDIHGSVHRKNYFVLPWRRFVRSVDVDYLVIARPLPTGLSANNSFKPNPLRGSA